MSPAPSHHATKEIPSRPSPPTDRPITAPPLYETARAAGCPPLFAAIAVLPLAEVAAFIPENPAATDASAPAKKAIVVSTSLRTNNRTPTAATNNPRIRYSALRKAIAPSCISSVISATTLLSIFTLFTRMYNIKAITSPTRPVTAAIKGMFVISIINTY